VHGLQKAYLSSFQYVWVSAAVFSLVAGIGTLSSQFLTAPFLDETDIFLIAACFMVNPKDDLNMHVDAPLEVEEKS
jgi:hypothetical protein